jgi:hypothetical protein
VNAQEVFAIFDSIFYFYLMRGFQKYARNSIPMMAFMGRPRHVKDARLELERAPRVPGTH